MSASAWAAYGWTLNSFPLIFLLFHQPGYRDEDIRKKDQPGCGRNNKKNEGKGEDDIFLSSPFSLPVIQHREGERKKKKE